MNLKFAAGFIHYYFTSATKHSVHSPFVFNLVTKVLNSRSEPPSSASIEKIRRQLLHDYSKIKVTDQGTAWGGPVQYDRSLAAIIRHSAKPLKYARLLFRLVSYFKPRSIVELGTSFGFSAMYLASGNAEAKVFTLEGCPETARIASRNFQQAGFQYIELITGRFDDTMDNVISKTGSPRLVFFDGNHRREPTLKYFEKFLAGSSEDDVFVFDDIHWSDEMSRAWEEIKNHHRVSVTIDLYVMGIVFLKTSLSKQHFTLRF